MEDVFGKKFGKLTAIAECERIGGDKAWMFQCDCGNKKAVRKNDVVSGRTKSCGCHRVAVGKDLGKSNSTHGMTNTPEHHAWHHMRQRCTDVNYHNYADYGGRGIVICERWTTFEGFFADMGLRPGGGFSLDRIDVNGNYEPQNCRWADDKTQQRNRRKHRMVTYKGETLCVGEWAERVGMTVAQLWVRLFQHKWPVERAMTEPVRIKQLITA